MKNYLFSLALLLLMHSGFSQDYTAFKNLFKTLELPYTPPVAEYNEMSDEISIVPNYGKNIDNATFNAVFGVDIEQNAQYQAVGKIEKPNYFLFLIYEVRIDSYTAAETRSFQIYTYTKAGEELGFRHVSSKFVYQDELVYSTSDLISTLTYGTLDDNKNNIILTTKEKVYEAAQNGDYNMSTDCTYITFEMIDVDGKFVDITTAIEEE